MAIRVTQNAIEILVGPGNPNARVTQDPVEVLAGPGPAHGRVTQDAVEVLVGPGIPRARVTQDTVEFLVSLNVPALDVGLTQEPLEITQYPYSKISTTQGVLEEATWPTANIVSFTHEVLEFLTWPLNKITETQCCLEVVYYGTFYDSARVTQIAIEILVHPPGELTPSTTGPNRMTYWIGIHYDAYKRRDH